MGHWHTNTTTNTLSRGANTMCSPPPSYFYKWLKCRTFKAYIVTFVLSLWSILRPRKSQSWDKSLGHYTSRMRVKVWSLNISISSHNHRSFQPKNQKWTKQGNTKLGSPLSLTFEDGLIWSVHSRQSLCNAVINIFCFILGVSLKKCSFTEVKIEIFFSCKHNFATY